MTLVTEVRRFKDLIAFRFDSDSEAIAFHADTLEVAGLSEQAFYSLPAYNFSSSDIPNSLIIQSGSTESLQDAQSEIQNWALNTGSKSEPSATEKVSAMTLNVTQLCNLHCSYCAAGGDGTYGDPVAQISIEKSFKQLNHFLSRLNSEDSFSLTLLGGEPLLYPKAMMALVLHVQKLAQSQGFTASINLITNGTLIDGEIALFLATNNVHVTLSMDGPAEINDQARPQKDKSSSSEKSLRGLELLIQNKCRVMIHSVFTAKHCDPVSAYLFFSQFPVRMEFTLDLAEKNLDVVNKFSEEMFKVAALAYERGLKETDNESHPESELRRITLFDAYFNQFDHQTKSHSHCRSGKGLISIDSRNNIFACPLDVGNKKFKIGDDLEVNPDAFDTSDKSLIELNNCQTCWARHLCAGGCMFSHKSMTGDKNKKDTAYCTRTRRLISLAIMYYLKIRSQ